MSQNNQAITYLILNKKVQKLTIHQLRVKRAVKGLHKLKAEEHQKFKAKKSLNHKAKEGLTFKVKVRHKVIKSKMKNKQNKSIKITIKRVKIKTSNLNLIRRSYKATTKDNKQNRRIHQDIWMSQIDQKMH